MDSEQIKQIATEFDGVIEDGNKGEALKYFSPDCEIELLSVKLTGLAGAKKWLAWLFKHVEKIKFKPVTIMVEGNTFFEEFVVEATLPNGRRLYSKQAEVLKFEDGKVKSLRIYFDRLDFKDAVAKDPLSGFIVKTLIKKSLKGLQ